MIVVGGDKCGVLFTVILPLRWIVQIRTRRTTLGFGWHVRSIDIIVRRGTWWRRVVRGGVRLKVLDRSSCWGQMTLDGWVVAAVTVVPILVVIAAVLNVGVVFRVAVLLLPVVVVVPMIAIVVVMIGFGSRWKSKSVFCGDV
jgi:hypothetical protein